MRDSSGAEFDVIIVGAGAAGLMTAISIGRHWPKLRVLLLDGATKPGAKILVAGGGRCNVTNETVTARDYCGGSRALIGKVLRQFTVADTIALFREIGVRLKLEETKKYFPVTDRAKTVLDALLAEVERVGVTLLSGHRVSEIRRENNEFVVVANERDFRANKLVLATGGQSLPKSGSDGAGYSFARALGHGFVPTTPSLSPMLMNDSHMRSLAGISHEAEISLRVAGEKPTRVRGAVLWTHFGMSGPAVLDASRHWLQARLARLDVGASLSFVPGVDFAVVEQRFVEAAIAEPKLRVAALVHEFVPTRVAGALCCAADVDGATQLAHLARDARRSLVHTLTALPIEWSGSRGYNYAEATAGGVPLNEADWRTMSSRVCPGLYLVGEILDVDGRIGGFNFQWAWASGWVCGRGMTSDE
ncbi:MAG: NAD(P)/FAD-dependent oxidoreductase [Phycisphaerae bacterium]